MSNGISDKGHSILKHSSTYEAVCLFHVIKSTPCTNNDTVILSVTTKNSRFTSILSINACVLFSTEPKLTITDWFLISNFLYFKRRFENVAAARDHCNLINLSSYNVLPTSSLQKYFQIHYPLTWDEVWYEKSQPPLKTHTIHFATFLNNLHVNEFWLDSKAF